MRMYKRHHPTRETPVATRLVSTIQVGNHTLTSPGAWIGLEEENQKFITNQDLGRGIIYTRASEIIVNTSYIQGERENPIDLFNYIVFGKMTDNSKTIRQYRSNFLQDHNDYQTKYLFDWGLNTISSGYSLILGIINGLMYLNPEDFFFMCDNWCKNLAHFCRKDGIPLRTIRSSNEARMLFGGYLYNRQTSDSMEIHSLYFRINVYNYLRRIENAQSIIHIDRPKFNLSTKFHFRKLPF